MLQAYIRSFKTSHQDRNLFYKISEIKRFPALQYASADERVPCLHLKENSNFWEAMYLQNQIVRRIADDNCVKAID